MGKNRIKSISKMCLLVSAVSLLLSACSAGVPSPDDTKTTLTKENDTTSVTQSASLTPTESLSGGGSQTIQYEAPQIVFGAAENVYTGTLLSKQKNEALSKEIDVGPFVWTVKVRVKDVLKGDFQPGTIIEDQMVCGFSDLNCDYLFMTGVDASCGYNYHIYTTSENVYSGTLLSIEQHSPPTDESPTMYKVTVKVNEVMKGDFTEGETVEDITSGHYNVGDEYIFMTGNDDPYSGLKRLDGYGIAYDGVSNLYRMIKLHDDGSLEYVISLEQYSDKFLGWQDGKRPPKTYDELLERLKKESPFWPFFPQEFAYHCPCEYPDEYVEYLLGEIIDAYQEAAPLSECFLCERHYKYRVDRKAIKESLAQMFGSVQ